MTKVLTVVNFLAHNRKTYPGILFLTVQDDKTVDVSAIKEDWVWIPLYLKDFEDSFSKLIYETPADAVLVPRSMRAFEKNFYESFWVVLTNFFIRIQFG